MINSNHGDLDQAMLALTQRTTSSLATTTVMRNMFTYTQIMTTYFNQTSVPWFVLEVSCGVVSLIQTAEDPLGSNSTNREGWSVVQETNSPPPQMFNGSAVCSKVLFLMGQCEYDCRRPAMVEGAFVLPCIDVWWDGRCCTRLYMKRQHGNVDVMAKGLPPKVRYLLGIFNTRYKMGEHTCMMLNLD